MLTLLKRLIGRPPEPSHRPPNGHRRGSASAVPIVGEPIPVPDVVEGNGGESDWNLWEDSVLTLDSQMHPLEPTEHATTQPMSTDELNTYAKARRSAGG